jgi:uncharacterized protein YigE (DUF2233 family)
MKPNGIFYVSVDRAAVAETGAFVKQSPQADLATQSGPMLVLNGRLHLRFNLHSMSLKMRNGVGVHRNPWCRLAVLAAAGFRSMRL